MNLTVNIAQDQLDSFEAITNAAVDRARPDVLAAMRDRFYDIVTENFGVAGPDRPWAWHELSPKYAAKVGRTYATLEVTGALRDSLMKGGTEGDTTTVSMSDSSVPYATAHHEGAPAGNRGHPGLPARRVFPIFETGDVMPWTFNEVLEAARAALGRELS